MKNILMACLITAPIAVFLSGCLGETTKASISAAINTQYSTESSCLQLESGSSNQYCSISVTVQNNQTGTPLSIYISTAPNTPGLPAWYTANWSPALTQCQQTMNNNIGSSSTCNVDIQYTGGNESATANVYFMLCTSSNCSASGNPVAITSTPIQINSSN